MYAARCVIADYGGFMAISRNSDERNLFSFHLDGCIVWNAHNTVFGSKRSAIYAQDVYFLHSTRRSDM